MNANIIIDVRNSVEKEISSINMSVQLDASFRPDVMSVMRALLLKMLTNDDIMKVFNLRACEDSNILNSISQNGQGFNVDIEVDSNNMLKHRAVMGPRPCDKAVDKSIRLHISAQC